MKLDLKVSLTLVNFNLQMLSKKNIAAHVHVAEDPMGKPEGYWEYFVNG